MVHIRELFYQDCDIYKKELEQFIYESVRNSAYTESYRQAEAQNKADELKRKVGEKKAIVFGAFDEQQFVAFVWAYPCPYREDTNRMYINLLHVAMGYNSQVLGAKLLSSIEKKAHSLGFDSVFLHTEVQDDDLAFYDTMGYRPERVQLSKQIATGDRKVPSEQTGEIKRLNADVVHRHKKTMIKLYEENVRAHDLTAGFTYEAAEAKIDGLISYLQEGKALLYGCVLEDDIVGMLWTYSYPYKGETRQYVGAVQVNQQYRGLSIGRRLYQVAENDSLNTFDTIFTHVDASNHNSLKFHESVGFVPEVYQLLKKIK